MPANNPQGSGADAEKMPVICLAGPTGAGKTSLALKLAAKFNGEIINADSRQTYADFPVITAQPARDERQACQHHLYGFLPAREKINAGKWLELAEPVARDIHKRGKTPIFVGGTGLYFHALLHGLASIPAIPDKINAHYEALLQKNGSSWLYGQLARIDPSYAARTHPNDKNRVTRALAVHEATGRAFSWWHDHSRSRPFCAGPLFVIDVSLDWLLPRLKERIDKMLACGALEEARAAWEKTPDKTAPGWTGIGCRELADLITGATTLEECARAWLANTRAYAKRQLTWFRGRPESVWLRWDNASLPSAIMDYANGQPD